jgi:general secretion pathway protein E
MTYFIADAISLMSIAKPITFGVFVGLWAYVVGYIDKDAKFFYLKRQMWNAIHLGVGTFAWFLVLIIPMFWIGLPLALVLIIGALIGYHFYRNTEVKEKDRWRMSLDSFRARWNDAQAQRQQAKATVVIKGQDGAPVDIPLGDDPLVPVYEALSNLLDFALPRRADRIDMVADASQTTLSVHIDGVKYPQTKLDPRVGLALIDYLKKHAGMDVEDRRKKQTGKLELAISNLGKQKFELTSIGSTKDVNLAIEINPHQRTSMKFDKLGLLDVQKNQLVPALDENLRCVLVVCPPGHGMTSTLHSLVERHDPYTQNIMTLEHEITHEMEGVTHNPIKLGTDAPPIAQQLRTILLREPRVVLVGNLTDGDTAKLIPEHVMDMRFYVGIRQTDAFTALRAWIQAIGDKSKAAQSLNAIVAQRLVRKLCQTCREPYQPDANMLRKLNFSAENIQQFYKHSGQVIVKDEPQPCPHCMGLGYYGRVGVFEVMVFDDESRDMVAAGQLDKLRSHMRKNKMYYLQEAALTRVVEGVTSISEITRVLVSSTPTPAASAKKSASQGNGK